MSRYGVCWLPHPWRSPALNAGQPNIAQASAVMGAMEGQHSCLAATRASNHPAHLLEERRAAVVGTILVAVRVRVTAGGHSEVAVVQRITRCVLEQA